MNASRLPLRYDVVTSNGHEKWQLVSNLLLANYRYTGNEDNWSKCMFGSVVYYTGAYIPRLPLSLDTMAQDLMLAEVVMVVTTTVQQAKQVSVQMNYSINIVK